MATLPVSAGQAINIQLSLTLPAGTKLTKDAPSFWSLSAEGTEIMTELAGKKDLKMHFNSLFNRPPVHLFTHGVIQLAKKGAAVQHIVSSIQKRVKSFS